MCCPVRPAWLGRPAPCPALPLAAHLDWVAQAFPRVLPAWLGRREPQSPASLQELGHPEQTTPMWRSLNCSKSPPHCNSYNCYSSLCCSNCRTNRRHNTRGTVHTLPDELGPPGILNTNLRKDRRPSSMTNNSHSTPVDSIRTTRRERFGPWSEVCLLPLSQTKYSSNFSES